MSFCHVFDVFSIFIDLSFPPLEYSFWSDLVFIIMMFLLIACLLGVGFFCFWGVFLLPIVNVQYIITKPIILLGLSLTETEPPGLKSQ